MTKNKDTCLCEQEPKKIDFVIAEYKGSVGFHSTTMKNKISGHKNNSTIFECANALKEDFEDIIVAVPDPYNDVSGNIPVRYYTQKDAPYIRKIKHILKQQYHTQDIPVQQQDMTAEDFFRMQGVKCVGCQE